MSEEIIDYDALTQPPSGETLQLIKLGTHVRWKRGNHEVYFYWDGENFVSKRYEDGHPLWRTAKIIRPFDKAWERFEFRIRMIATRMGAEALGGEKYSDESWERFDSTL